MRDLSNEGEGSYRQNVSVNVYTYVENVQELFCGRGLQGPRCQHLGIIFVREKLQKDHSNITYMSRAHKNGRLE